MSLTEVPITCPECEGQAKAVRITPRVEEGDVPSRIPTESIACSNSGCDLYKAIAWP